MACGGCTERARAIGAGVKALIRGDVRTAAENSRLVVKSAAADAAATFRVKVSAARARLGKSK
jgi:hypothetical protein